MRSRLCSKQFSSPTWAGLENLQTKARSPPLGGIPVIDILPDLVLRQSVPLLNFAFELFSAAMNEIKVIIGELSPLLLDLPLHLLPITLDSVPVHPDPPLTDVAMTNVAGQHAVFIKVPVPRQIGRAHV